MDAEAEKEKIKELIKSLYNITDDDVLESFARDSMEFEIENKYDVEGDDYVKPYAVEDFSDNIVKTTPFDSLLTSNFVEENKNTINKHVIFESLEIDVDDDFKSNDLDYIFYDDCVNNRYSGYTVDYSRESEFNSKDFEDKMHDLDEDLIKNNNSELKL